MQQLGDLLLSEPDPWKIGIVGLINGAGWSVHCWMLGNFINCKVCRVFCWTRHPYKRSTGIFPTWHLHSVQLSKTKENEKMALVRLVFPINAHQNAIEKPIRSPPAYRAQCTLPPQPIYQTLFFNFSRVWFRDQRSVGMHLTENILKLDTPKCLLRLFSFLFFFEGGQKKYVQFLTNRISIVATHTLWGDDLKVAMLFAAEAMPANTVHI